MAHFVDIEKAPCPVYAGCRGITPGQISTKGERPQNLKNRPQAVGKRQAANTSPTARYRRCSTEPQRPVGTRGANFAFCPHKTGLARKYPRRARPPPYSGLTPPAAPLLA